MYAGFEEIIEIEWLCLNQKSMQFVIHKYCSRWEAISKIRAYNFLPILQFTFDMRYTSYGIDGKIFFLLTDWNPQSVLIFSVEFTCRFPLLLNWRLEIRIVFPFCFSTIFWKGSFHCWYLMSPHNSKGPDRRKWNEWNGMDSATKSCKATLIDTSETLLMDTWHSGRTRTPNWHFTTPGVSLNKPYLLNGNPL